MIKGVKSVQDILDFPDSKVTVRYSESVGDHEFILKMIDDLIRSYYLTWEEWEIFSDKMLDNLWENHKRESTPLRRITRNSKCLDSTLFFSVGPIPEKAMNWLIAAFKDHGKRWVHFQTDKMLNHGTVVMGSWISSEKPCF